MKTLKLGDKNNDVRLLQQKLNITADGIFGKQTELAVKVYQNKKGLVADGIVGKNTWNKIMESDIKIIEHDYKFKSPLKKRSKTSEIILHCSATPEGKDFTVDTIHKWHIERKFSGIGYQYVIYRDGSIHRGRPEDAAGAHATDHNSVSIGICYIGGTDKNGKAKDTRTVEQKESMYKLVKYIMEKYNLTEQNIYCHNDFSNKACPSFKRNVFIEEFYKYINKNR